MRAVVEECFNDEIKALNRVLRNVHADRIKLAAVHVTCRMCHLLANSSYQNPSCARPLPIASQDAGASRTPTEGMRFVPVPWSV